MRRFGVAVLALGVLAGGVARAADPWDGGDAAAGKVVFVKCSLCHYAEKDKVKIGPSLWGVVGRKPGTLPVYADKYSDAMKAYGNQIGTWTPEHLFVYLEHPMQVVKGTKMTFVGLPNPDDRKNVIAYLETLK